MTDAGAFSTWLGEIDAALQHGDTMDVPCGNCTACCTSSQFIHIEPDETETLAHIPAALRFPAPYAPEGHVVLGYDERGHCPMLVDGACSIYEHRPRTCRTYDCRVLAAAGVTPGEDEWGQRAVAERARRWRFRHPTDRDRRQHEAVQAAASFVRDHPEVLPDGAGPLRATQLAVLALSIRDAPLDTEAVRVAVRIRGARRPSEE